jgi:hypothetical protein
MTSQIFPPHGEMDTYVHGQVLVVHAYGSWNMEMRQQSRLRTAPLIAQLQAHGPWGNIVVVHDTLVSGLELFESGRKSVEAIRATGQLKAAAWVIAPSVEGYGLLLGRYRDIYKDLIPCDVFDDLPAAMQWIEGQLAGSGP